MPIRCRSSVENRDSAPIFHTPWTEIGLAPLLLYAEVYVDEQRASTTTPNVPIDERSGDRSASSFNRFTFASSSHRTGRAVPFLSRASCLSCCSSSRIHLLAGKPCRTRGSSRVCVRSRPSYSTIDLRPSFAGKAHRVEMDRDRGGERKRGGRSRFPVESVVHRSAPFILPDLFSVRLLFRSLLSPWAAVPRIFRTSWSR